MPFAHGPYVFSKTGIDGIKNVGGVYGLARQQILNPRSYVIVYVGKSDSLPDRLRAHLNNPPAKGITHFFAEAIGADAARTQRELALIKEFKPVGNTLLK